MRTLLNILLLLAAIAWTYYENTHKAHAEAPPNPIENTQRIVDSGALGVQSDPITSSGDTDENTGIYGIPSYFVEESLREQPSILISRLLGSLAGSGTSAYRLERLTIGLEYEKLLTKRIHVASLERIASDAAGLRMLDRVDRALLREKNVIEHDFPFVQTLTRPGEDENDIRTMIRPFLDTKFYELDIDETASAVEYMGEKLQSGNIGDHRKFVAIFLIWKIYQERLDTESRFICETPAYEENQQE